MLIAAVMAACALLAQVNDSDAPAAEDKATVVRQLVRELDSRELAAREQAEQKLLELGPGVLDLLPPVTPRTTAEVKERLGRVREKLNRAQAEAAVEPSMVSVTATGLPLSAVLADIQEQSGNKIADYREQYGQAARDPQITLSFDPLPFWEALDRVLQAGGSTLYAYPEGLTDSLAVIDEVEEETSRSDRPVSYAGPFRLEAVQLEAVRDLRSVNGGSLNLQMEMAWEPRLRPISLEQSLEDLSATDEQGNPIPLAIEEGAIEITVSPGSLAEEMRIPFVLPDRGVRQIASLKGKFTALLPGKMETFRFADVQKSNQQASRAGVTVILEQTRKNNDLWEVRVRVRFDDPSGSLQSHYDWVLNNEVYLQGPDKQPITPDAAETTRRTDDEAGMAYLFAVDGALKGYSLVYKTPSVIVSLPVTYEMKDLDLP